MKPLGVYKIVPGEQGNPIVLDVDRNIPLFPTRSFPSKQVAIDALKEHARERGWTLNPVMDPKGRIEKYEAYEPASRFELRATPEFESLLTRLADRIGGTPGEAILKGLVLLEAALDAKDEGKRLVIVDDKEGTEEEITEA